MPPAGGMHRAAAEPTPLASGDAVERQAPARNAAVSGAAGAADWTAGSQCTCYTGTTVQILTQKALLGMAAKAALSRSSSRDLGRSNSRESLSERRYSRAGSSSSICSDGSDSNREVCGKEELKASYTSSLRPHTLAATGLMH